MVLAAATTAFGGKLSPPGSGRMRCSGTRPGPMGDVGEREAGVDEELMEALELRPELGRPAPASAPGGAVKSRPEPGRFRRLKADELLDMTKRGSQTGGREGSGFTIDPFYLDFVGVRGRFQKREALIEGRRRAFAFAGSILKKSQKRRDVSRSRGDRGCSKERRRRGETHSQGREGREGGELQIGRGQTEEQSRPSNESLHLRERH